MNGTNGIAAEIQKWLPVSDSALQWYATISQRRIEPPPIAASIAQQAAREAVWPASAVVLIIGLALVAVLATRGKGR
jgi:hypothetical protein